MNGRAPLAQMADYAPLSERDFDVVAGILRENTGIHMVRSKRMLMQSRLTRRLRRLGLDGFASYRKLLQSSAGATEIPALISALTTNVTRFFREPAHFHDIEENVLPRLLDHARAGGRVRFWSAGCSMGEEPYSLAFILLRAAPDISRLDVRILATDIDQIVLETAARGEYPATHFEQLPTDFRQQGFLRKTYENGRYTVCDEARKLVVFRRLNLLESWPFSRKFDVILCRNVVIYFDQTTQQMLWPKFSGLLAPKGRLYLGHSERVSGAAMSHLLPVGSTTYTVLSSLSSETGATR